VFTVKLQKLQTIMKLVLLVILFMKTVVQGKVLWTCKHFHLCIINVILYLFFAFMRNHLIFVEALVQEKPCKTSFETNVFFNTITKI